MEDLYFGGEQPTVGGRIIMEDLYFGGEQPTVGLLWRTFILEGSSLQ